MFIYSFIIYSLIYLKVCGGHDSKMFSKIITPSMLALGSEGELDLIRGRFLKDRGQRQKKSGRVKVAAGVVLLALKEQAVVLWKRSRGRKMWAISKT